MKDVVTTADGAVFQAEVLNVGPHRVQSYGFVWNTSDPNIKDSDSVLISTPFAKGTFETKINYSLAKGLEYSVRPFATYVTNTVYGNRVTFKSLGSERSPWSLLNTDFFELRGWSTSTGSAMNGNGLVLFQSSDFYAYDPLENSYSRIPQFPIRGNTGSKFTPILYNSALYFFNNMDLNLYKYEDRIWTLVSKIPFRYDRFFGYFQGLASENSVMALSSYESYEYNVNTNSWFVRSPIPTSDSYSVGGTSAGNKAYVLTKDKIIWEYISDTDTWNPMTEYPGVLYDKIVSFSYNDKIYFGLSYHTDYKETNWSNREFWSFDLTEKVWSRWENFPKDLAPGDLHHFFTNERLYIGHEFLQSKYDLYEFDPGVN